MGHAPNKVRLSGDPFSRNLLLRSLAVTERRLVATHLEEVSYKPVRCCLSPAMTSRT